MASFQTCPRGARMPSRPVRPPSPHGVPVVLWLWPGRHLQSAGLALRESSLLDVWFAVDVRERCHPLTRGAREHTRQV